MELIHIEQQYETNLNVYGWLWWAVLFQLHRNKLCYVSDVHYKNEHVGKQL